ncbi:hypothetical protein VCR15J2_340098 [Vibrio coralliirubri]|nr:hypothetical protein VCR15J2_340098 [Vibrio coralliirubri]
MGSPEVVFLWLFKRHALDIGVLFSAPIFFSFYIKCLAPCIIPDAVTSLPVLARSLLLSYRYPFPFPL